jgi:dTDP-4-amino-4,6-dideoxygalactose transaminase
MLALGIGAGDEVIVTPRSFMASASSVVTVGATPVWADVELESGNLSASTIAPKITTRTKAILLVHMAGWPCEMDEILDLASAHGIAVIEDCAQCHGATYKGKPLGGFGVVGSWSFCQDKILSTAGEGGMVTTDDDQLADRLRLLRNQGMRERYVYEVAGHNWRMTDLQAAIALPQLPGYASAVEARQRHAALLSEGLADIPGIITPTELPGRGHVWHQYTIRVTDDCAIDRATLIERLTADGIGCGIYYPHVIRDYDCYRDHARIVPSPTPVAERCAREVLSLPVHQHLTNGELEQIVASVRRAAMVTCAA